MTNALSCSTSPAAVRPNPLTTAPVPFRKKARPSRAAFLMPNDRRASAYGSATVVPLRLRSRRLSASASLFRSRTVGRSLQGIKSATEISPLLKRNGYAGNKLFSIYSPKKEMAGVRFFLTVELVQTRSHSKCFGVCCAKKSFQYGREVL